MAGDMPTERRPVTRFADGALAPEFDELVAEAPLEIRLSGVALAVVMRTPGRDLDLVTGFALTEGIALRPAEIDSIRPVAGGEDARYEMIPADGVVIDPERFRRNLYATSSCGVCGKASIDAVRVAAAPAPDGPSVAAGVLLAIPDEMRSRQQSFSSTGGLHAAALFTESGAIIDLAEDVGRHNAVDKVIGAASRERWPLHGLGLFVSGRTSFEIVQKAAVAGLGLVAGVSAASALAADLAQELGLTVAGFVRGDGFNIYTHPERIQAA